jgi:hypothetical protein
MENLRSRQQQQKLSQINDSNSSGSGSKWSGLSEEREIPLWP